MGDLIQVFPEMLVGFQGPGWVATKTIPKNLDS